MADALPRARHRQHGHRGQPHRRLAPVGPEPNDDRARATAARGARPDAARRAQGRGPVARLRRPRHPPAGPARRLVRGPARRVVRPRRRVRLRQVDHGLRRGPLPAAQRGHHRRPDPRVGRRHHPDERRRGPPVPDPPRLDGLPGPGCRAQSDDQDRAAGRRGVHGPRPEQRPGEGERAQGAAPRPDRRSGGGRAALPAPAVGRDAAARRHRHRARLGPQAAGARRADDRARRHGRGERARPRPLAPGGDQRRGPADRPQPRRHPDDVRPGRGDVRRQDRRGGRRGRGLRAPRAPVHARAPALAPAPRHPQDRARAVHDPGQPAADRDAAADLRLRRPLPAGRRAVPDRRAAGRARSATVAGRAATIATGSRR